MLKVNTSWNSYEDEQRVCVNTDKCRAMVGPHGKQVFIELRGIYLHAPRYLFNDYIVQGKCMCTGGCVSAGLPCGGQRESGMSVFIWLPFC